MQITCSKLLVPLMLVLVRTRGIFRCRGLNVDPHSRGHVTLVYGHQVVDQ